MHPSILAKRRAQAMDRIVQSARLLDPEHAEALHPKGIKDPATAEMMRLEAIAALLERLGTVVTAVTEIPLVESIVNEPVDDPRPTLDDFPAHVVKSPEEDEDDDFEAKPPRRATKRTKKSSTG
jgi:hypothetical protein